MKSSFFAPLLSYLDDPGAHLKSTEASRIMEDLVKSSQTWRGARVVGEEDDAPRESITDASELIEAMETCDDAFDPALLDDLLIHNISQ